MNGRTEPREAGAPRAGRGAWLELLLIAAATLLAYSNSFHASFHLDDVGVIVDNDALRDLARLWPPRSARWLGDLTFALDYRFGALDPFGYHLVNVLIHVCNGLLVHRLATATLRTPALRSASAGPLVRRWLPLAAGLLFALHPLATQAVTYVVQRYAALATLLFLSSLLLFARARRTLDAEDAPASRAAAPLLLAVIAAAGAMATKEIAVTLPLVAAGFELLFFPGRPRRRLLLLVPLAATALIVPLARARTAGLGELTAETGEISRATYLLTQTRVVARYLRLLLLPVGQNFDYDFPLSTSLGDPRVLFSLGVILTVVAVAVLLLVSARRRGAAAGVLVFAGAAWFFVTLSVESSIIPIRDVIFEHRVYLPGVGAALALGTALLWGVERLRLRARPALQCAVVLLVTAGPLGVATWSRNLVWRDDLTLWSDVVAKSPGKARPHHFLGLAHFERGENREAIAEYLVALRIRPWYPEALVNLGNAYRVEGRIEEATLQYARAVRIDPRLPVAHNNLGAMYELSGRLNEALVEYREALRLAPGLEEARINVARLRARSGRGPTAPSP